MAYLYVQAESSITNLQWNGVLSVESDADRDRQLLERLEGSFHIKCEYLFNHKKAIEVLDDELDPDLFTPVRLVKSLRNLLRMCITQGRVIVEEEELNELPFPEVYVPHIVHRLEEAADDDEIRCQPHDSEDLIGYGLTEGIQQVYVEMQKERQRL